MHSVADDSEKLSPVPLLPNKLLARTKLEKVFSSKDLQTLSTFSPEGLGYLVDFFLLLDGVKFSMRDSGISSNLFSDYGFVLLPVYKAYEDFVKKTLRVLGVKLKPMVPLGNYLAFDEKRKREHLKNAKKTWISIEERNWLKRWNSMGAQWTDNRNPMIHPDYEKIENLDKAYQIAVTIMREMELTAKLLEKDVLTPLRKMAEESAKKVEE